MLDPHLVSTVRLHLATLHAPEVATRLLAEHGSPTAVFRLSPERIGAACGRARRARERLLAPDGERRAILEIRRCEQKGIRVCLPGGPGWPSSLDGLPEMPLVLFVEGSLDAAEPHAVGVVGSRRASPYGLRQARRFARELAAWGVPVVSGLARGIDGVAQQAALEAGGRTVAVLGSGLDRVYPPEHRAFAAEIAASGRGALVTEFPLGTPPRPHHFPRRNRLLSGLSRLLLVVEAGERSGSLITAEWALRQGRSVWVVPGRVDHPAARGSLSLLRDGAGPAIDPDDLRGELGLPLLGPGGASATAHGSDVAGQLVAEIGPVGERLARLFEEADEWSADDLASRLEMDPSALLPLLATLEISGRIARGLDGRIGLR